MVVRKSSANDFISMSVEKDTTLWFFNSKINKRHESFLFTLSLGMAIVNVKMYNSVRRHGEGVEETIFE